MPSTRPPLAVILPAFGFGAGVEDFDIRQRGRRVEPADHRALAVVARVAIRRHHDQQRGLVVPAQVEILQLPVARRDQRRHKVGAQPQHQHLALRIAEARVVLDQLRAIRGDHQSGEEDALERRAHLLHGAHRRRDDLLHGAAGHLVGHHRARANRRPCRRCSAPCRRRRRACGPAPTRAGSRSRRRTARRTRLPRRRGIPRSRPPRPPRPSPPPNIMSIAASASAMLSAMITPLPAARPSALMTIGTLWLRA